MPVMEDLIEALNRNTAIHEKVLAALGGKAGGAASGTASTPSTGGAAGGAKAGGAKAGGNKPAAIKPEDMAKEVTAYMQTGDADDRATAKANVRQIVEHFGVDRFTAIAEGDRAKAMTMLRAFVAGETPEEFASEDGGDDGESMV